MQVFTYIIGLVTTWQAVSCLEGHRTLTIGLERVHPYRETRIIKDYEVPETNFSCAHKKLGEYYADLETRCRVYHVCLVDIGGQVKPTSFVCPNGTLFNQASRVCGPADRVHCSLATNYYENLHGDFYRRRDDYGDLSDHIEFMKIFPQSAEVSRLSARGDINDFGEDLQIPEEQRESFVTERSPLIRRLRRRKLRRRPGKVRRRNQSRPRQFAQTGTVRVTGDSRVSHKRTFPPSSYVNVLPENHSETFYTHVRRTGTSKPPSAIVGTSSITTTLSMQATELTTATEETQPLVNPFVYQSLKTSELQPPIGQSSEDVLKESQPELLKDISRPENEHLYKDPPNIQKITLSDNSRTPEIPVEHPAITEAQPLIQLNLQLKKENSNFQKLNTYSKSPLPLDHSVVQATGQQTLNSELKVNVRETNSKSPIVNQQISVNPSFYQSVSQPKLLSAEDVTLENGFNKEINSKNSESFNDNDVKSPSLSVDEVRIFQKPNNSYVAEMQPQPILLNSSGKTEKSSGSPGIAGKGDTLESYSPDNSSPIRSENFRDHIKPNIPFYQEPRRKHFRTQQYRRTTAPPQLVADGPKMLSRKQQDVRRISNNDRRRGLRRRQGRRRRPLRRRNGLYRRQQINTSEGTKLILLGDSAPKRSTQNFKLVTEEVNNFTPSVASRTSIQNSAHDSMKHSNDVQVPAAASSSQPSRLSFTRRQNTAVDKLRQKDQVRNESNESIQNMFVGNTNLNSNLPSDPFADLYHQPHRQSSTSIDVWSITDNNPEKNATSTLGKAHELQPYSMESYSGESKTASSFQSSEHNLTSMETRRKQKSTPITNIDNKNVEGSQPPEGTSLFSYQSPDRNVDVVPNKEDKIVGNSQFDEETSLFSYQSPDRNVDVVPNKEDKIVGNSQFDEETSLFSYQSPDRNVDVVPNKEDKIVGNSQFDEETSLFSYQSPDRNVDVVPNKEDKNVENSQFDEETSLFSYQSPDRNVDVVPNKEDKVVGNSQFDEETSLFSYQSPDRNVDVVPNKEDKNVENSQFDEKTSLFSYQSPDRNAEVVLSRKPQNNSLSDLLSSMPHNRDNFKSFPNTQLRRFSISGNTEESSGVISESRISGDLAYDTVPVSAFRSRASGDKVNRPRGGRRFRKRKRKMRRNKRSDGSSKPLLPSEIETWRVPYRTSFQCTDKVAGYIYGDIETDCEMFHVCIPLGKGKLLDYRLFCANGTAFNQETGTCQGKETFECWKVNKYFIYNKVRHYLLGGKQVKNKPFKYPKRSRRDVIPEVSDQTKPITSFTCDGKPPGGYYPDYDTGCQLFHLCAPADGGITIDLKFWCGNDTIFNHRKLTCEPLGEASCEPDKVLSVEHQIFVLKQTSRIEESLGQKQQDFRNFQHLEEKEQNLFVS
ncbi:uncharacterized protein LOC143256380 [Tachypleus tridentatus]|uniref:uncharacterized protein LOC143256380 n=1 Tax=Tachypleus tridentatus TaxID=6853 RepID=UPI003FD55A21